MAIGHTRYSRIKGMGKRPAANLHLGSVGGKRLPAGFLFLQRPPGPYFPAFEEKKRSFFDPAHPRTVIAGPFCPDGRFQCQGKKYAHPISQRQSLSETKEKGWGLNPTPLLDTFRLQHPDHRNVVTFHGFRRFVFRFRFDYIFVPSYIRVQDAKIIQLRWKKRYPSDHFPLLARIEIPAPFIDSNSDRWYEEMIPIPKAR